MKYCAAYFNVVLLNSILCCFYPMKIELLFEAARNGTFERLGMKPLEVREKWDFGISFPETPFVIRGDKGKRHFDWSERLHEKWNGGAVDAKWFATS